MNRDEHVSLNTADTGAVGIGRTPLVPIIVPLQGRRCRLWLKLEGLNVFGSLKARTAHALLQAAERSRQLEQGGAVVESTSGNLGIALAGICRARGYSCTLVVDENTPQTSRLLMRAAGAALVTASARDGGNPVEARLNLVRRFLAEHPDAVWTNQYGSGANPRVHREWTGPELADDFDGVPPDAVAVPVSTGGTFAGLSAFFREWSPSTTMIAVDAVGSAATGGRAAPRSAKIPGFGSGRESDFLSSADWGRRVVLHDLEVAEACRVLAASVGLTLGGSAAAAVLGAIAVAIEDPGLSEIAVICPDMGEKYLDLIWSRSSEPTAIRSSMTEALACLRLARSASCRDAEFMPGARSCGIPY
ncbi:pyridoxal-phosphate dependent enzyme [Nocardia sp. NPDC051570]|uniref:pyridoxal-phosphate dependent enzyme n=1 Tax=Nocardia sp. NPDC051570 TaxID=3364324 RepID=UPI0037AE21B9